MTNSTGDSAKIITPGEANSILWGDEVAGYANDKFYLMTPQMAIVVACFPPGGGYRASEQFKPIYDSDECLYVLNGQYTICDPETGEVQTAESGEMVLMHGPQWHFGNNFSDDELRVFEVIAPLDIGLAGARTAPPAAPVSVPSARLQDFPRDRGDGQQKMELVRKWQALSAIHGTRNPMLMRVFAASERVSMAVAELAAGRRSEPMTWAVDAAAFVEHGTVHFRVADAGQWLEAREGDLFHAPAGTSFEVFNHGGTRANVIFAVAGNIRDGLSPRANEELAHASEPV